LFSEENPDSAARNHEDEDSHFLDFLNPDSITVMNDARAEISLADTKAGDSFQFEREGYFTADPDTTNDKLVFNRTVSLRDSWAKAGKLSTGKE
ncbi:MAG: hypothetical protein KAI22_04740, partial [Gammaproteobacteria bacterium]|nr:hypothetical protein [Gammaproteobacteria bacterium]